MLVLVVLRLPHLVLPDVGHDDGVAVARLPPQIIDHVRGIKMAAVGQVLNVAHRRIAFQFVDRIQPLAAINRFDMRHQLQQDFPQIADQRNIDLYVLVNLRRINLDVNLLSVGARKFSVSPVTRSSKRMPKASSRSAS